MNKIRNLIEACVFVLLVFTVISFLGKYWWLFDVLANARLQFVMCAFLGFVILLGISFLQKERRKKTWLFVSIILLIVNAYPIYGFFNGSEELKTDVNNKASIRFMSLNILTSNNEYEKVINEINSKRPDIILLMEVNAEWVDKVSEIEDIYKYKIAIPREHNFGLVMYSKFEFVSESKKAWGDHSLDYIEGSIKDANGNLIYIIGAHTIPPISEEKYWNNRGQFKHHIENTKEKDSPVVLMGDFNMTPWAYSYQQIIADSGLDNAAALNSYYPNSTWQLYLMGGVMIDHILVKNMQASSWHIGNDVGSDHRAVIADIAVRDYHE